MQGNYFDDLFPVPLVREEPNSLARAERLRKIEWILNDAIDRDIECVFPHILVDYVTESPDGEMKWDDDKIDTILNS